MTWIGVYFARESTSVQFIHSINSTTALQQGLCHVAVSDVFYTFDPSQWYRWYSAKGMCNCNYNKEQYFSFITVYDINGQFQLQSLGRWQTVVDRHISQPQDNISGLFFNTESSGLLLGIDVEKVLIFQGC